MGKKKFIGSGKGTTYRLVHRSQQDRAAAEGEEGDASAFVLVPAEDVNQRDKGRIARRHKAKRRQAGDGYGGDDAHIHSGLRDHINALGMPDDGTGYDYDSHMRTMGGGTFIDKDGHVGSAPLPGGERPGRAVLPAESLPAEDGEVLRSLTAITISDRVMDADMRAIINGEVEEFEELEDDFVLQAAGDDGDGEDGGGFDFDAHIARLIAASEQEVGLRPRRREDDLTDSEDEEEGSDVETASSADGRSATPALPHGDATTDAALAAQFEATLAEYDSDAWGEGADEDVKVEVEVEVGAVADACMDEFLREQGDENWFGGLGRRTRDVPRVWQGERAQVEVEVEDGVGDEAPAAPPSGLSGPRLGSLRGLGQRSAAAATAAAGGASRAAQRLSTLDEDEDDWRPIDESFDYFKKPPEERWDCETVLSTYSNLDNHPTVLSAGAARGARARGGGGGGASSVSAANPAHAGPIVLSRKTGLPLGVLPSGGRRKAGEAGDGADAADDAPPSPPRVNKGEARARGESAEERRARKVKVKEERRGKREDKAAVKEVFREGGKVAARTLGNAETANRRSVFAYS